MNAPSPLIPRYGDGCLSDVVAALCTPSGGAPDWVPGPARGAERLVLLVLDGLGWNQMIAHRHLLPVLSGFSGGAVMSVVPSTTATALTSLTTGLDPASHGLVGWRMLLGDAVMNVLRWVDDDGADLRRRHEPRLVQSCPPFLGMRVPVLSRAELEGTGFTGAHLAGTIPRGWRLSSSLPMGIRSAVEDGHTFVYAYYDGIDKIAHERGFGEYYDAELRAADHLVAEVINVLPTDAVLLVTADHGQVMVGDATIAPDAALMQSVAYQSGEGRFRWLHLRQGASGDALSIAREKYGDIAWVVERDRVIDEGWFGPRVSDVARRRMGDVALVPYADVSFSDPLDSGPFVLQCRHGSLTPEEMDVPLLAFRAGN